jgi:PAS domain S-box-containing protein
MAIFRKDQRETNLQETGKSLKTKSNAVQSLKNPLVSIDLIKIMDIKAIQSLMDDFHQLTKIGVAIVDIDGNVLVATGWQDICTQFHRKHPELLQNCVESDVELSAGIEPGSFKAYHCKNNMWDIATPIVVGGNQVGNLFLGQFFYEDEIPDYDYFRSQAKKYNFNETAYLAALDRVPRWSKETVQTVIRFYAKFADLISKLSYSNVKLLHELNSHESTIKSLKESEEKLRAIFNASPLAMVLLDQDGYILDSNEVHAQRINMTRTEILGKKIWEFLPEEVLTHRKKQVQDVFETGRPFSGEDQRGNHWIQYHIHPAMLNKNGNVEAVIVEAIDITDRKKAGKQIAEALSWYQEIFEGSKDAIFISDENARFISVNSAACDLTGYEPKELTSMRIPDLHDEMDLDAFNTFHARIIGGEAIDSEAIILRRDGRKIDAEFNNKRITVSGKHYMHTTARDISDRKLAEKTLRAREKALRESEEKYRILFENTGDALLVAQSGTIVFPNHRSTELTGYSTEELQSRPFIEFIHEDDREMVMGRHLQRLRGEKPTERYPFRIIHKNGSILWVELNAVTIQWNEKPATLCFLTDITDRRQAEEDLRFQSMLLNQIQDHITATDLDGNIVYINDAEVRRLKRSRQQLIGTSVYSFGEDSLRGATQKRIIDETLKNGEWRGEVVNYAADGNEIIFDCRTRLIQNTKGVPISMVGISTDITQQKQRETAIRQSEEKFRTLVNTAPFGIQLTDLDGRIVYSNPAHYKMQGYRPNELIGMHIWDLMANENHRAKAREYYQTIVKTRPDPAVYFNREKTRDGRKIEVKINWDYIRNEKDEVTGIISIIENITEHKKAEEQLQKSEERFRNLYDDAPVGYFEYDLQGNITRVNRTELKMLGYTSEEMIGQPCWKFIVDEAAREQIIAKLRGDRPPAVGLERTYRRKDGTTFPVLFEDRLLINEKGDITGIRTAIQDITERVKLQNQLNQAQKMESIGSLAGGIAHDFNNILFPIVGLSEMMLEDFPSGSLEQQNLNEIFQAGKRGRELVQQILSFSRQSEHQPMPVHIQKILKEVLKLCRATIPADITISRDIQNDCGPVLADPTQIHQIAMNLITNAYHAVEPTGGTISIQLTEMNVASREDLAGDIVPGRYAMLSVSDTGTGIDGAVIDKIFDPYFTTKEKGRGTGLGLATVYGIVKTHGGDIKVISDIGNGATFHVYLPLMEKAQESDPEKEMTQLLTGTEHILLVDDEKSIIHLEKQMLKRLGYQTSGYTSSRVALAAFKTEPSRFDLVITDMNMPNMNGMQLAAEMIAIRQDIPIILCTGFSERINKENAAAMGIKGLLMKPVVMKDLAHKVREVLK